MKGLTNILFFPGQNDQSKQKIPAVNSKYAGDSRLKRRESNRPNEACRIQVDSAKLAGIARR